MEFKKVTLKDNNGNAIAPATVASNVAYDDSITLKEKINSLSDEKVNKPMISENVQDSFVDDSPNILTYSEDGDIIPKTISGIASYGMASNVDQMYVISLIGSYLKRSNNFTYGNDRTGTSYDLIDGELVAVDPRVDADGNSVEKMEIDCTVFATLVGSGVRYSLSRYAGHSDNLMTHPLYDPKSDIVQKYQYFGQNDRANRLLSWQQAKYFYDAGYVQYIKGSVREQCNIGDICYSGNTERWNGIGHVWLPAGQLGATKQGTFIAEAVSGFTGGVVSRGLAASSINSNSTKFKITPNWNAAMQISSDDNYLYTTWNKDLISDGYEWANYGASSNARCVVIVPTKMGEWGATFTAHNILEDDVEDVTYTLSGHTGMYMIKYPYGWSLTISEATGVADSVNIAANVCTSDDLIYIPPRNIPSYDRDETDALIAKAQAKRTSTFSLSLNWEQGMIRSDNGESTDMADYYNIRIRTSNFLDAPKGFETVLNVSEGYGVTWYKYSLSTHEFIEVGSVLSGNQKTLDEGYSYKFVMLKGTYADPEEVDVLAYANCNLTVTGDTAEYMLYQGLDYYSKEETNELITSALTSVYDIDLNWEQGIIRSDNGESSDIASYYNIRIRTTDYIDAPLDFETKMSIGEGYHATVLKYDLSTHNFISVDAIKSGNTKTLDAGYSYRFCLTKGTTSSPENIDVSASEYAHLSITGNAINYLSTYTDDIKTNTNEAKATAITAQNTAEEVKNTVESISFATDDEVKEFLELYSDTTYRLSSDINKLPYPLLAIITRPNVGDKYHTLGISYDGLHYNEVSGFENFGGDTYALGTDAFIFKYNDWYLMTFTLSNPSKEEDGYLVATKDFETFHKSAFNFGIGNYLKETLGVTENDAVRWVPQLFLDKNNNLSMIMTWGVADKISNGDAYGLDALRKNKIYVGNVVFNEDTATLEGSYTNFNEFVTSCEWAMDANIMWDADINAYRVVYKDRYNQWINYGTTPDLNTAVTDELINVFGMIYTEAPVLIKYGATWQILGVHYSNHYGYPCNLAYITSDFVSGDIKMLGQTFSKYGDLRMRNLAPIQITDKALITFFAKNSACYTGEYKGKNIIRFPKEEVYNDLPLVAFPGVTYNVGNIEASEISVSNPFKLQTTPLVKNTRGTLKITNDITSTTVIFYGTQLPVLYSHANGSVSYSAYNYTIVGSVNFKGVTFRIYSDYRTAWMYGDGTTTEEIVSGDSIEIEMSALAGNTVPTIREYAISASTAGANRVFTYSNGKITYNGATTIGSGVRVLVGNIRNTIQSDS